MAVLPVAAPRLTSELNKKTTSSITLEHGGQRLFLHRSPAAATLPTLPRHRGHPPGTREGQKVSFSRTPNQSKHLGTTEKAENVSNSQNDFVHSEFIFGKKKRERKGRRNQILKK